MDAEAKAKTVAAIQKVSAKGSCSEGGRLLEINMGMGFCDVLLASAQIIARSILTSMVLLGECDGSYWQTMTTDIICVMKAPTDDARMEQEWK